MLLLSLKELSPKNSLDRKGLKSSYKAFLHELQPSIPIGNSLECELVTDFDKGEKLARCFNLNLQKEGIDQLIGKRPHLDGSIVRTKKHLSLLRELDPHLHSLFVFIVNILFFGASPHAVGGTTSAAIGVVWGNPDETWNECDYLEFFVHELTHTLMFLDELRFLHYKNQSILYEKENFSLSAILQAERPIDRVLHSIVVATEVLMLRARGLVDHSQSQIHPSTNQLIESTQTSIDRLLSHPNANKILTDRSFQIVENCRSVLSQYFALNC